MIVTMMKNVYYVILRKMVIYSKSNSNCVIQGRDMELVRGRHAACRQTVTGGVRFEGEKERGLSGDARFGKRNRERESDFGVRRPAGECKGCCIHVIQRVVRSRVWELVSRKWGGRSGGKAWLGLWNGAGLVTDREGDEGVECQGDGGLPKNGIDGEGIVGQTGGHAASEIRDRERQRERRGQREREGFQGFANSYPCCLFRSDLKISEAAIISW